jgi:transposase-like protein
MFLDFPCLFCHQACMKIRRSSSHCCPNPACRFSGQFDKGNIIRHSYYTTTQGRRRRYHCKECGKTFCSTHGSPYYRLHKPKSLFDEVILMCVHGIAISAVARIKWIAWGTVSRWLELAATVAKRFNHQKLRGFVIDVLQADEIRTFVANKDQVV